MADYSSNTRCHWTSVKAQHRIKNVDTSMKWKELGNCDHIPTPDALWMCNAMKLYLKPKKYDDHSHNLPEQRSPTIVFFYLSADCNFVYLCLCFPCLYLFLKCLYNRNSIEMIVSKKFYFLDSVSWCYTYTSLCFQSIIH